MGVWRTLQTSADNALVPNQQISGAEQAEVGVDRGRQASWRTKDSKLHEGFLLSVDAAVQGINAVKERA